MIFELINPHDFITLEAQDFRVACHATLILGKGAYGLVQVEGRNAMPPMLWGGVPEWWKEVFEEDISEHLLSREEFHQICDILDSLLYATREERELLKTLMPDLEAQTRKRWLFERRTSEIPVVETAYQIAKTIRENLAKEN